MEDSEFVYPGGTASELANIAREIEAEVLYGARLSLSPYQFP